MEPNQSAFPEITHDFIGGTALKSSGLTMRDYVAIHTMTGYLSMFAGENVTPPVPEIAVEMAYKYADALIAQSNKK